MSDSNKNIDDTIRRITGNNVTDLHKEIIDIIGKDKILAIYKLIGKQKISFFPMKNLVEAEQIVKSFTETNKPITEISREANCDRSKVYYTLKRFKVIK